MSNAVVLQGVGRLGSAILEGWLLTGAVDPKDLIILTPSEKPVAEKARALGARINPPLETLAEAKAFVIGVKPAKWVEAAQDILPHLSKDAVIVSVMAGVPEATISAGFDGRKVVRIMPTTGVAQGKGVASLWSSDAHALAQGMALFEPIAETAVLDSEDLMHAATAVSGCGPAYFFAFTRALAEAGVAEGLPEDVAVRLARATLRSAAAGVVGDESLDALIDRVASPGGVTRAGLEVLNENGALDRPVQGAVKAAVDKSTELSG
ncbi:pyrroline-5-carboxylate reductase [uncultured Brevundimonas sp.]|uniref:pyrroline-5-carboxylate reductase n=1 Tax=uncultured Brevundimonas sp. TaxID=213418 RepID=UPI00261F5BDD|nr:pyrroline-5-carboxylate reductase [uncultured Brevundimonas sp.]